MSTVSIPYHKLYLLQQLSNKLALLLIVVMAVVILQANWLAIMICTVLLLLWRPKGNFIAVWRGKDPALLISEEGFIDYVHGYNTGIIPWGMVKAAEQYGFLVKLQVRVTFYEPKQLLKLETSTLKRLKMMAGIFIHQTPYHWDRKMLGISQHDFLKILQEVKDGNYDFNNFGRHLIEQ